MIYEYKTRPYNHQREALRQAEGREGFAWLMEMGAGKTKVAIDEMSKLILAGSVTRVLILAPKAVYMNWLLREIPTHMPDSVRSSCEIVEWRPGGGSSAHQVKLNKLLNSDRPYVLIMNIEAMSSGDKALKCALRHVSSGPAAVYLDESTTIKNPTSTRTKRAVEISRHCAVRRIMTGSPATRSPLDIYSQFEFLGRRMLGFSSYFSFRARYAVIEEKYVGGRVVKVPVAYRDTEDLARRIKPHSYRVTKEECLDLPPKIYTMREVELSPQQRRMYDEVRRSAQSEIGEGSFVSATQVMQQMTRMHQILCGHVRDEEGNLHYLQNNRLETMMEVIEESCGKVIIWSAYRPDIDTIVHKIREVYGPQSVVEFHGGTTLDDRERATTRFQEDPECRFIVSNETGARGNTWTAASHVIYYSNGYNLETRIQSEDRAHRVGQKKSVTYTDLYVPGTIDERVIRALRDKIDIASTITGDKYREWLI